MHLINFSVQRSIPPHLERLPCEISLPAVEFSYTQDGVVTVLELYFNTSQSSDDALSTTGKVATKNTISEPCFLGYGSSMVDKTVPANHCWPWLTMFYHMVEPHPKPWFLGMVQPLVNHGIFGI